MTIGERVIDFITTELPALDALGDRDFALARQQRDGAHLAQIHADGIVRLFQRTRCQVEVAAASSECASSLTTASRSPASVETSTARAAFADAWSS